MDGDEDRRSHSIRHCCVKHDVIDGNYSIKWLEEWLAREEAEASA